MAFVTVILANTEPLPTLRNLIGQFWSRVATPIRKYFMRILMSATWTLVEAFVCFWSMQICWRMTLKCLKFSGLLHYCFLLCMRIKLMLAVTLANIWEKKSLPLHQLLKPTTLKVYKASNPITLATRATTMAMKLTPTWWRTGFGLLLMDTKWLKPQQ